MSMKKQLAHRRQSGLTRRAPVHARQDLRRRREAGAMLIEALVVILIFSFGLLGMVALQTRATKLASSVEDANRAALLANELEGQMWARRTADVSQLADVISAWKDKLSDPAYEGRLPDGKGTAVDNGNGGLRITITWQQPGLDTLHQYVTDVYVN
jgi:type IV pilus assembly protein PilV